MNLTSSVLRSSCWQKDKTNKQTKNPKTLGHPDQQSPHVYIVRIKQSLIMIIRNNINPVDKTRLH